MAESPEMLRLLGRREEIAQEVKDSLRRRGLRSGFGRRCMRLKLLQHSLKARGGVWNALPESAQSGRPCILFRCQPFEDLLAVLAVIEMQNDPFLLGDRQLIVH